MKFVADDKFDEVIRVLQARNWERIENVEDANLIWTNLKNIDFQRNLDSVIVNHFKGSQHLSNKAFLAYHLYTHNHDFLPVTWSPAYNNVTELIELLLRYSISSSCRPNHLPSSQTIQMLKCALAESKNIFHDKSVYELCLQAVNLSPNKLPTETLLQLTDGKLSFSDVWIVKPVGLSCGERIEVSRGLYETLKLAQSFNYKCIVQKYIENPLLVRNNRKFDIRQWILVVSLNPLVIYGFSECYLRLSSKEFALDADALSDKFVHLCNHAIQKENASSEDQGTSENTCDTMMTQDEFSIELHRKVGDISESPLQCFQSKIQNQIKTISIETIKSVKNKMEKSNKSFEWLGLDLMITEDLQVKLIEVNVSPDISHSTPVTSRLVTAAVEDTVHLLLDELPAADTRIANEAVTSPRWELWFREESGLSSATTTEQKSSLRPDCKPLFASTADKILQNLSKLEKVATASSAKVDEKTVDDEDDEI